MAPQAARIIRLHVGEVDSTQQRAKELSSSFDPSAVTLLTADSQTAGRGRQGRSWISSDPGNLYASFITFPPPNTPLHNCSQLLALSAATALQNLGYPVHLKWPNDLMLNNLKVGGVLTELSDSALINGIGINISSHPEGAIALSSLRWVDKEELLKELSQTYQNNWQLFLKEGFLPFFDPFIKFFPYKRGSPLSFHAPSGERINGQFESISPSGALLLQRSDGSLQQFFSGDIR